MPRSFALVLVTVAVTACVAAPIAPPVARSGTTVNASFGKTWNGIIDVFATKNIPIKTIDRSSGIIVTEQLAANGLTDMADCGSMAGGGSRLSPTHASYNVLVRGDSSSSVVKVTPRFVRIGVSRSFMSTDQVSEECSSTGTFETELERQVKQIAEAAH